MLRVSEKASYCSICVPAPWLWSDLEVPAGFRNFVMMVSALGQWRVSSRSRGHDEKPHHRAHQTHQELFQESNQALEDA
jgi:hypothetical protein